MALEFHKMHGAGNDFVLIDARGRDFTLDANRASKLADRHRGIGCDQILVLRKAVSNECVARYEIWNSDGSPASQAAWTALPDSRSLPFSAPKVRTPGVSGRNGRFSR